MIGHSDQRLEESLTVTVRQLAGLLRVSMRHVQQMNSVGLLPRPVRLGRSVRWLRSTIESWLNAGAPNRAQWERKQEVQEAGSRPDSTA